jgi:hypothetical protein
MIISHKYKFIFIKTMKTAGSSLEAFFSKVCGDEDTFTYIHPPIDGHVPRNRFSPFDEGVHHSAMMVKDNISDDI